MSPNVLRGSASLALLLTAACVSFDYDLSSVPVPVSAKPAEPGAREVVPLHVEQRNVLWFDGLFGHTAPDVAALVTEAARGYDRVTAFKVRHDTNFHQWLLTHLSLTLVRMKTVVITGELVND